MLLLLNKGKKVNCYLVTAVDLEGHLFSKSEMVLKIIQSIPCCINVSFVDNYGTAFFLLKKE
jgi:hypothetical protein